MKGRVSIILAAALAALAVHYTSTAREPPVRLLLSTETPIDEIDRCLEVYGKQPIRGLDRYFHARVPDGSDARQVGPTGATYLGEEGAKVTLTPRSNLVELKVRAPEALQSEQIAILRRCASRPG